MFKLMNKIMTTILRIKSSIIWSKEYSNVHLKVNVHYHMCINAFLASGNFCHLLITFENSLDPDQGRLFQTVGPDLDLNRLIVFLKEF